MSDETLTIQGFIDAGGPGTVIVLEGTCTVSAPLLLRKPVTITGGKLVAASGGFSLIEVEAAGSGATIRDTTIQGAAATTDGQYAIWTSHASPATDVTVTGCRISGTNSGVKLDTGSSRWQIVGNRFSDLAGVEAGHGYGVLCGNAEDNLITWNSFFGAEGYGRHAVYLSGGASHNLVTGNMVEGFQSSAIAIYSTSTQPPSTFNLISNNTARHCGDNLDGDSGGIELAGRCVQNIVSGNVITGFAGNGIIVTDAGCMDGSCDNEVSGNTVDDSGWNGILLKRSIRTTLHNNMVRDSSQEIPQTCRGIMLWSTVGTSLIGNTSIGTSQRDPFFLNLSTPLNTGVRQLGNSWQAW